MRRSHTWTWGRHMRVRPRRAQQPVMQATSATTQTEALIEIIESRENGWMALSTSPEAASGGTGGGGMGGGGGGGGGERTPIEMMDVRWSLSIAEAASSVARWLKKTTAMIP